MTTTMPWSFPAARLMQQVLKACQLPPDVEAVSQGWFVQAAEILARQGGADHVTGEHIAQVTRDLLASLKAEDTP
jgi:hypothetical protein